MVLSGHPTFGKTLVIDGEVRVGDPSELLHHGRLLIEEIRRAGARAVLLVPPRRPGAPVVDRQAVEWAYHRLGREAGALLAPVGEAFERVRRQRPELALFDRYGREWSPAGAYLAASVLEATVTGRFPGAAAGPEPAEASTGAPAPEPIETPSVEERHLLNQEAWAAVRDLAAAGGSRDLPPPSFPPVPTLPRGEAVDAATLEGTWRGPFRLYPWPASLELRVTAETGTLEVSGRVHFEDGRPGIAFEGSDPRYEGGVLSFRNPADLAAGRTEYELVFRRSGLTGVAELVTETGGAYAVGGFELTRIQ